MVTHASFNSTAVQKHHCWHIIPTPLLSSCRTTTTRRNWHNNLFASTITTSKHKQHYYGTIIYYSILKTSKSRLKNATQNLLLLLQRHCVHHWPSSRAGRRSKPGVIRNTPTTQRMMWLIQPKMVPRPTCNYPLSKIDAHTCSTFKTLHVITQSRLAACRQLLAWCRPPSSSRCLSSLRGRRSKPGGTRNTTPNIQHGALKTLDALQPEQRWPCMHALCLCMQLLVSCCCLMADSSPTSSNHWPSSLQGGTSKPGGIQNEQQTLLIG